MEKLDSRMMVSGPTDIAVRIEVLILRGHCRTGQRQQLRQWLQEAYPLYWLDESARPYVLRDATGRAQAGVAFSYAAQRGVLAIAPGAYVGLDVCEVQPLPDALDVAALYLSASTVRQIRLAANLEQAFALAWARFEAALKCQGLAMAEGLGEVVNVAGLQWQPVLTIGSAVGAVVTRPF